MGIANEPARRDWIALGLLALLVLGAWLGRLDLLDPDEGRHAEIAREMIASGSFLTPRLQGEPYHHKPVAFHWTVAASLAAFGHGAAAARLPSVLAALVVLAATGLWARRAYSARVALLAVTGLSTTPFFVAIGRLTTLDMLFCATLVAALAWLGCWLADPAGARRTIFPFYVAVGLATLVKGPAAIVLCGSIAVAAAASCGRLAAFAELKPLPGGLLVLPVAIPWYLAAGFADPAYIEEFLLRHNLARYLGGGDIGHQGNWWYYPVFLPLSVLPWTPLAAAALVWAGSGGRRQRPNLYCLLWIAIVIAFFAPASTKLVTYMLPAFPPLAVLSAAFACRLLDSQVSASRVESALASLRDRLVVVDRPGRGRTVWLAGLPQPRRCCRAAGSPHRHC